MYVRYLGDTVGSKQPDRVVRYFIAPSFLALRDLPDDLYLLCPAYVIHAIQIGLTGSLKVGEHPYEGCIRESQEELFGYTEKLRMVMDNVFIGNVADMVYSPIDTSLEQDTDTKITLFLTGTKKEVRDYIDHAPISRSADAIIGLGAIKVGKAKLYAEGFSAHGYFVYKIKNEFIPPRRRAVTLKMFYNREIFLNLQGGADPRVPLPIDADRGQHYVIRRAVMGNFQIYTIEDRLFTLYIVKGEIDEDLLDKANFVISPWTVEHPDLILCTNKPCYFYYKCDIPYCTVNRSEIVFVV